jgi:cell wall-associated NlpC family hydrolase
MARLTFQDYSSLVGQAYSRYNCWALVIEFYRLHGIVLDEYHDRDSTVPPKEEINSLIRANIKNFEKVTNPEYGDILLFRIEGIESHIGVYVGDGRFLHSLEKQGSAIGRLSMWKSKLSTICRCL